MRRVVAAAAVALGVCAPAAQATLAYTKAAKSRTSVWVANDDGSSPRKVSRGSDPVVSPDGLRVAYVRSVGGALRIADVAARTTTATPLKHTWNTAAIRWSADSRYLSVVAGRELGPYSLKVYDLQLQKLTTLQKKGFYYGVTFSPLTDALVWSRAPKDSYPLKTDLYSADLTTLAVTRLTTTQNAWFPVWGPTRIAFARTRQPTRKNDAPKQDIWAINPDGSGLKRITKTKPPFLISGLRPVAWSADGKRLLASFEGQDTAEAFRVDPSTGEVSDLTSKFDGVAAWGLSRAGDRVLASTSPEEGPQVSVLSVDWVTGKRRTLARHAFTPSWNG